MKKEEITVKTSVYSPVALFEKFEHFKIFSYLIVLRQLQSWFQLNETGSFRIKKYRTPMADK